MRLREHFTGRATLCGAALGLEFGHWGLGIAGSLDLGNWDLAMGDHASTRAALGPIRTGVFARDDERPFMHATRVPPQL
jgi:hypothetical protein